MGEACHRNSDAVVVLAKNLNVIRGIAGGFGFRKSVEKLVKQAVKTDAGAVDGG